MSYKKIECTIRGRRLQWSNESYTNNIAGNKDLTKSFFNELKDNAEITAKEKLTLLQIQGNHNFNAGMSIVWRNDKEAVEAYRDLLIYLKKSGVKESDLISLHDLTCDNKFQPECNAFIKLLQLNYPDLQESFLDNGLMRLSDYVEWKFAGMQVHELIPQAENSKDTSLCGWIAARIAYIYKEKSEKETADKKIYENAYKQYLVISALCDNKPAMAVLKMLDADFPNLYRQVEAKRMLNFSDASKFSKVFVALHNIYTYLYNKDKEGLGQTPEQSARQKDFLILLHKIKNNGIKDIGGLKEYINTSAKNNGIMAKSYGISFWGLDLTIDGSQNYQDLRLALCETVKLSNKMNFLHSAVSQLIDYIDSAKKETLCFENKLWTKHYDSIDGELQKEKVVNSNLSLSSSSDSL